jgi:hypothetical protein
MISRSALLVVPLVWALSCGGHSAVPQGQEKGACYPNHTCAAGLSCFSNICVRYGGQAGATGAAGSMGAAGTAGSAMGGAAGVAGSSAASGGSGVAGGAGGSGVAGGAGSSAAGASGAAGSPGTAGSSGTAGASGAAGSGGAGRPASDGGAGQSGAAGTGSDAGTTDGDASFASCDDAASAPDASPEMLSTGACGYTPGVTTNAYTGFVTMRITGLFVNSATDPQQDAFYSVSAADTSMSVGVCDGCLRYNRVSEGDCVCLSECPSTSHSVSELLVGPYPAYSPSHDYTVKLNLGAGAASQLHFGVADCGCSDNAGGHTITLTPTTADACVP